MDLTRIATALRHCGRAKAFIPGKAFHSRLIKLGTTRDVFLANNLISMYMSFCFFEDANKMFDEMPERNVVTWTAMISGYTDGGRPNQGLRLFDHMLESDSETPNGFVYSAVLKACGVTGDLELGRSVHERVLRDNLVSDTVLMNALLDMYVKCGSLGEAEEALEDGIVDQVAAPEEMFDRALELAESVKAKARMGVYGLLRSELYGEAIRAFQSISYVYSRVISREAKVKL